MADRIELVGTTLSSVLLCAWKCENDETISLLQVLHLWCLLLFLDIGMIFCYVTVSAIVTMRKMGAVNMYGTSCTKVGTTIRDWLIEVTIALLKTKAPAGNKNILNLISYLRIEDCMSGIFCCCSSVVELLRLKPDALGWVFGSCLLSQFPFFASSVTSNQQKNSFHHPWFYCLLFSNW